MVNESSCADFFVCFLSLIEVESEDDEERFFGLADSEEDDEELDETRRLHFLPSLHLPAKQSLLELDLDFLRFFT